MDVLEIRIKSALVRSRIPGVDYVINPYLGCGHGCRYCYAVFMRKYSHHPKLPWGSFVEAKINIAEVLDSELHRKRRQGRALLSSVCDPYQPLENRYRLTRACLEVLRDRGWGIDILTRSPLVTRDLDLLAATPGVSVGFSIPTDDDAVRKVLEPHAPPIGARLSALSKLHEAGISTWVFVAPILPMNPARLYEAIAPHITHLMVDPLNYRNQVRELFLKRHWEYELSDQYAGETRAILMGRWERRERGVEG
ncbi:MAG: radical SAM protein [Desulfobaccales bacterium]